MKEPIFLMIVVVFHECVSIMLPRGNYSTLRNEILEYERRLMIGANLTLNDVEKAANKILMDAKEQELAVGFQNTTTFAPARNFLIAKRDIEKSKVYELLRLMPKGAVLHAHDISLASSDYVYHNITYRDDLYVCVVNGVVKLHFFREPNKLCNWELLKKVRGDPMRASTINKMIKQGLTMECTDPMATYTDVDKAWSKFRDIFSFMNDIVTYKPVYKDYFLEALEQLYKDNVMYLELRSTLPTLYDFDGTKYKPEDVVDLYIEATERFKKKHPDFIGVKLIYAPVRLVSQKIAENYIKIVEELRKKYPNFVAGFDLVGQEDKGHTLEYFANILRNEENRDLKFFFHAGETNWLGTSSDENLVDAILLNTQRIGHGYALASHPFLLEIAQRMNIAIEICPISNQVLKLVDDLRNHAARSLLSEGYPVVISNDDPGFWGATGLSFDFYETFMGLMSKHADLKSLKQLAINSLRYSSMTNVEIEHALNVWQEKWHTFIEIVSSDKL